MEAHIVQSQIQALVPQFSNSQEKDCEDKWNVSRGNKIKSQIDQLKVKQGNELSALRQKIDLGKEEQRKAKELGLERLKQKYNNVKKELEVQQLSEVSKFEKSVKNTCSPSFPNLSRPLNV